MPAPCLSEDLTAAALYMGEDSRYCAGGRGLWGHSCWQVWFSISTSCLIFIAAPQGSPYCVSLSLRWRLVALTWPGCSSEAALRPRPRNSVCPVTTLVLKCSCFGFCSLSIQHVVGSHLWDECSPDRGQRASICPKASCLPLVQMMQKPSFWKLFCSRSYASTNRLSPTWSCSTTLTSANS